MKYKYQNNDGPYITVITSTLNCAEDLKKTVESLRRQVAKNCIQWVVADGGSTDGTIEIINNNLDIIDVWFSEHDDGIYDAWNKALEYADGQWVQFLGAGDEYYDEQVIQKILPVLRTAHPTYDLVYGRLQYITCDTREFVEEVGASWQELKGKWEYFRPRLPIHPEVFHHTSLFKMFKFDPAFKIAGDSHFLMRCINLKDPLYVPIVIDKMPLGGASCSIRKAYLISLETKRASKDLGYHIPISHYLLESLKISCKRVCCSLLPDAYLFKVANAFRLVAGKHKRW